MRGEIRYVVAAALLVPVACVGSDPPVEVSHQSDSGVPAEGGSTPSDASTATDALTPSDGGNDATGITAVAYDPTFGENGIVRLTGVRSISGAPQGEGAVLYIDSAAGDGHAAVHRLTSKGALDPVHPKTTLNLGTRSVSEIAQLVTVVGTGASTFVTVGGVGTDSFGNSILWVRGLLPGTTASNPGSYQFAFETVPYGPNPEVAVTDVTRGDSSDPNDVVALAKVDGNNDEYAAFKSGTETAVQQSFGDWPSMATGGKFVATVGTNTTGGVSNGFVTVTAITAPSGAAPSANPAFFGGKALSFKVGERARGAAIFVAQNDASIVVVAASSTNGIVATTIASNLPSDATPPTPATAFAVLDPAIGASARTATSLYVGGCTSQSDNPVPWIARFTATGMVDTAFGSSGAIALPELTGSCINAMTLDDKGRLVVAASDYPFSSNATSRLLRFTQ